MPNKKQHSVAEQHKTLLQSLADLSKDFEQSVLLARSQADVLALKVAYLGKKGRLTEVLKRLSEVPPAERMELGKAANTLKGHLSQMIDENLACHERAALEEGLAKDRVDPTLPGCGTEIGHLHPIAQALDTIIDIFRDMGFSVEEGPEIETEYYNFEALNIPREHPSRDMQDTFYLGPKGERLLRTHTSPVQIHYMETHRPPFQMIAPGKVYRRDSDISHTPMFHQVEGLAVSSDVSMAQLKGVLEFFLKTFFGEDVKMRLRPSYFPFTEPSAEVDMSCILCRAKGCAVCKQSGWLEVMGAGMVHPKVFKAVGYDPAIVSGFAFGMGVERLAMLKYRVTDIRLFFENDIQFLEQF